MSVTSVTEKNKRTGDVTSKGRNAKRSWWVRTDSASDNAPIVEAAVGVSLFDELEGDPQRRVIRLSAVQEPDSLTLWSVDADYEYQAETSGDDPEQNANPLDRMPEVTWSTDDSREPEYVDSDGIPIITSALVTFDPPPDMDVSDPVLNITRNEALSDAQAAILVADYKGAVDEDGFLGLPRGTSKMADIDAQRVTEDGFRYYRVTYRIAFRKDGWVRLFPDEGRYEFALDWVTADNPTGHRVIKVPDGEFDDDGNPVAGTMNPTNDPLPLNGYGRRLNPDSPPSFADDDIFVFMNSLVYRKVPPRKRMPFGPLGLDSTLSR